MAGFRRQTPFVQVVSGRQLLVVAIIDIDRVVGAGHSNHLTVFTSNRFRGRFLPATAATPATWPPFPLTFMIGFLVRRVGAVGAFTRLPGIVTDCGFAAAIGR